MSEVEGSQRNAEARCWLAWTKLARMARERSLVRKRGFRRAGIALYLLVPDRVVSFEFLALSFPLRGGSYRLVIGSSLAFG